MSADYRKRRREDSPRRPKRTKYDERNNDRNNDREATPLQDADGHYLYQLGERIHYHDDTYTITRKLGEGTFGKVVEATIREEKVAIKIIRNVDRYKDAAKIETDVLRTIKERDPDDKAHLVRLIDDFVLHGHPCVVFEKLGPSLFDVLKRNDFRPFSVPQVRCIAQQCLEAVQFLHRNQLTHTDLKPENILFTSGKLSKPTDPVTGKVYVEMTYWNVKIIDLGSATFDWDHHTQVVTTRHYRAPEVVLALGWSHPCDLWSLGCIFAELVTGRVLFQTHDNIEHLNMMEHIIDEPIPRSMLRRTPKTHYLRRMDSELAELRTTTKENEAYMEKNCPPLPDWIKDEDLRRVVSNLLKFVPSERSLPHEALADAFFDDDDDDDDDDAA